MEKQTSSSSSSSPEGGWRQRKPFCDLCWRRDGASGMILQTCCNCKVSVHNECYGIDGDAEFKKKKSNWLCLACASVGMSIKVREKDPITNERIILTITERPTECVLCSVNDKTDWYHAMHPLYDSPGIRGRQIVIPADIKTNSPTRLAWAHTLCCFCVIKTSNGSIYGCTKDGQFDHVHDEESDIDVDDNDTNNNDDDNDDESINSYLLEGIIDLSIHHFVIDAPIPFPYYNMNSNSNLLAKKNKKWHERRIDKFQNWNCIICGATDVGTLRLPVKCCTNEEFEWKDFKKWHKRLHGTETCSVRLHVGCAMWGTNDGGEYPSVRRVFYYPGSAINDVIRNVFCTAHTQDLQNLNMPGSKYVELRYPKDKTSEPVIVTRDEALQQSTKHCNGNNNTKKLRPDKVNTIKKLKTREANEKVRSLNTLMIKGELKNKLHFSKKEILNKVEAFRTKIKAIYGWYVLHFRNKYGWDEKLVIQCFNIALNEVLRIKLQMQLETDYDIRMFLPAREKVVNARIVSAPKLISTNELPQHKPIQSTVRHNLEQNVLLVDNTNHKKKSSLRQVRRNTSISRISLDDSNRMKENKNNKVARLSESTNKELQLGEWDVGLETSSHHTQDSGDSHVRRNLAKGIVLANSHSSKTFPEVQEVHQRLSHLTSSDTIGLGTSGTSIGSDDVNTLYYDINFDDDDAMSTSSTLSSKRRQICDDIVMDILVQNAEYEQRSDSHPSDNERASSDHESTSNDNFTTKFPEENSLEFIIKNAKENWINRLVRADGRDALLSMDEFEFMWTTTILVRVYKALNYTPTPDDWTFLLDERNNPEKYTIFFNQWDSYEVIH